MVFMKSSLDGLIMRTMAQAMHCPVEQPLATQALSPGNVLDHRRHAPTVKHNHIPKNQNSTEEQGASHDIFVNSMLKQQHPVYTGLNKTHLFHHFRVSFSFYILPFHF